MIPNETLIPISVEILKGYRLRPEGVHGIGHWGRVMENGVQLAALTGANLRVVQLFALFHDSRRVNDALDPGHGQRGAALAGEMNGKLFTLTVNELTLLKDACLRHTKGLTAADITVQTCWDADRLDLPRVNILPVPALLCTMPARDKEFMALAGQRSVADHLTSFAIELSKAL
jgi:uncharacterized protein